MLATVIRFSSFGSIIAKTKVPIVGGKRYWTSIFESFKLFSLKRMQDYLQHDDEGRPDMSSRHVIPRAKTSSLSSMGGLSRTNPCRIFSICAGLMKPTSPSNTFSYAVIPPFTKQLSINFHSFLYLQIILVLISPCLHFFVSRNWRAEQTEKIILSISCCGNGKVSAKSARMQSKGSYSMMTWLQLSQKMLGV